MGDDSRSTRQSKSNQGKNPRQIIRRLSLERHPPISADNTLPSSIPSPLRSFLFPSFRRRGPRAPATCAFSYRESGPRNSLYIADRFSPRVLFGACARPYTTAFNLSMRTGLFVCKVSKEILNLENILLFKRV